MKNERLFILLCRCKDMDLETKQERINPISSKKYGLFDNQHLR
jgi:hypothetical protein